MRWLLRKDISEPEIEDTSTDIFWMYDYNSEYKKSVAFWLGIVFALCLMASCEKLAMAQEIPLKASWYSVESLKKEGTWKYSKGVMANGHIFSDNGFTCATRIFPLGTLVRVTNSISKSFVYVKVTDRIGKRFGKTRIDLSKLAFQRIASLNNGLVNVTVERIY
jgi:rare lipoprotein A